MDHFNEGESLTVLTAITKFGIYALSQRCGELERKHKYWLDRKWVKLPSKKVVVSYSKAIWPFPPNQYA
jgi:hypothetical protein